MSNDIKASVISDSYYSDVSTENADSVKITEDETFVFGEKVNYEVTHSIDDHCDMVSLEGEAAGDSTVSFADDVISLSGYDGGYVYLEKYIDGKGFKSIPIDVKELLEGITIEEIVKDPCKYGHMLSLNEAVAATSDVDGNIEYWRCNTCDKVFVFDDWQQETEIALEDTVIKRINTVSLNRNAFTYNGSVQRPSLIVKDSADKIIDPIYYSADFSNKDSKNVGTYKVKVTFKGNYAGTKNLTYKITKAANPMTVKAGKVTAKASKNTTISKARAFKVKGAKGKLKFKKISGNKKIKIASNGKVIVKKGLKKGRTYSVKVKVTAKGDANYKENIKKVKLKIRVK